VTRSRPVVAIDGPSGAGKSTVARSLARALGFHYVDTGALYRSVAYLAQRRGVSWDDGPALAGLAAKHAFSFDGDGFLLVDGARLGDAIRTPNVSYGASVVAKLPEVRRALLEIQRSLGAEGGVVLEGRDIGTTVFPDAELKIFLTATTRERARRRHLELAARGVATTIEEVERDQEARDRADRERDTSPLQKAADAVELVCDGMTADEVVASIVARVQAVFL
jgi:cytidylate kinase